MGPPSSTRSAQPSGSRKHHPRTHRTGRPCHGWWGTEPTKAFHPGGTEHDPEEHYPDRVAVGRKGGVLGPARRELLGSRPGPRASSATPKYAPSRVVARSRLTSAKPEPFRADRRHAGAESRADRRGRQLLDGCLCTVDPPTASRRSTCAGADRGPAHRTGSRSRGGRSPRRAPRSPRSTARARRPPGSSPAARSCGHR